MPRKSTKEPLKTFYSDEYKYEIGIDEVGRGPMSVSYTHLTLPTICSV